MVETLINLWQGESVKSLVEYVFSSILVGVIVGGVGSIIFLILFIFIDIFHPSKEQIFLSSCSQNDNCISLDRKCICSASGKLEIIAPPEE